MSKKILVTSALLYANGPLHIGHLVEYIQTDIYVRFLRLKNKDVLFVCADDTHGAPIQINAEKLGMKPEALIKKFYKEHVRDFKRFGIDFDNYYTTHSDENREFADKFFQKAKKNGYIFKKKIIQLYCESCIRFLPDRYVKGECPNCGAKEQYGDVCEVCSTAHKTTELKSPRCAICGKKPVEKESEHYFFKLSSFTKKLDKWLTGNKNLQKEIVNSVRQWIKEGLNDWDISRDGPYFGFRIPDENNLYYYVWWDAPIGYLASAENYLKKKGKSAGDYWNDSRVIHFIGKDIIYFHFLFWPAVLMACGYKLPENIPVHGFLTVNGEKMSKSRGTFYTAEDFLKDYDAEYLRYFYAGMIGRKLSDIDLNFDDFQAKINNELVANIGNFCYRAISFTNKNFDSKITGFDDNKELISTINNKIKDIKTNYESLNFKEATKGIMAISAIGNKYMQDSAPWESIKIDKKKAENVLGLCINIAKNLSILTKPIMPEFSYALEKQLNLKDLKWKDLGFDMMDHKIGKSDILIKKLEIKEKKEFPFDIRVAKIIKAETHPDADKLIVFKIDIGTDKRQIVAGLRDYYKPEELLNKKIIVLSNLRPSKLRGIESQGMLLVAEKGKDLKLITVNKASPGDQVAPVGYKINKEQISFDQFNKLNKLIVKKKKVVFDSVTLTTDKEEILIDMPDNYIVR